MRRIYKFIGRKFGKKYLRKVEKKIEQAGLRIKADEWIGFTFIFSILLAIALILLVSIKYKSLILIPLCLTIFILSFTTFQVLLSFLVRIRQVSVERVLPDYLSLVASYVNAGISLERSLLLSCKREFGVLSDEMRKVASSIVGGRRIEEVLPSIKRKFASPRLNSVIDLILEGIKSGANMADLLERMAMDMREELMVKKEIVATILSYASFIFLASCIASPLLFGISSFLFQLISKLVGLIGVSRYGFFKISPIPTSTIDLIFYANMVIISIFGSLFVGIIRKGDEREGLKYIPIMISLSFIIFFFTKIMLMKLFGKIFI